jgi:hypothetical protein
MSTDRNSVLERAKAERRQFKRVPVELAGRIFIPSTNCEAQCKIDDISPGGAHVLSEVVPPDGEPIVIYIDKFGRFEGIVCRAREGDFGIRFQCSAMKREKIAEQLTLHLNHGVVDETVLRRHDRAPTKGLARFTRASGEIVNCEVLDLSLGGVSLKTDIRPPLGEIVLIGQTAGRVARHHETGIALEFILPQSEKAVHERPQNPFAVVG